MPASSTVIVASYRPGDWLEPCLASVTGQADEVILVDNGSEGAAASTIGSRMGVRVIRRPRNIGFSPAVNLALRSARGQIIGLLNDDARAGPDWLAAAAEVLADRNVAAVTPKVVLSGCYSEWVVPAAPAGVEPRVLSVTVDGVDATARLVGPGLAPVHLGIEPDATGRGRVLVPGRAVYIPVEGGASKVEVDGQPVESGPRTRLVNHAGSFLLYHGIAGEHGFAAPDDGRFDHRRECFGFSGTAPVLSAKALSRIGRLAAPFFAYNEDTDWCLRAHSVGLKVVFDPAATVVHRLSATSGGPVNERVRRLSERNALLCLLRNAPRPVIDACVVPRLRIGPRDQVRREVLRLLPWALATRATIAARRRIGPDQLWADWADRDTTWDDRPVGADGPDLC